MWCLYGCSVEQLKLPFCMNSFKSASSDCQQRALDLYIAVLLNEHNSQHCKIHSQINWKQVTTEISV